MRPVLTIILFIISFSIINAQDVIIDKEGETIDCTILTVNDKVVVYRVNEQARSMPKEKIMAIYYGNGTKQKFEKTEQAIVKVEESAKQQSELVNKQTTQKLITQSTTDTISVKRGKYYIGARRVKEREVKNLIKASNCSEAKDDLKKMSGGKALSIIGNVIVGAGAGFVISDALVGTGENYLIGSSAALGGLTFVIIGESVKNKKLKYAIEAYNECVKK